MYNKDSAELFIALFIIFKTEYAFIFKTLLYLNSALVSSALHTAVHT
jgi:hypothetical protein